MTFTLFSTREAAAVPSYARQTGLPCQQCHVGAFGPQLKPFGRDFKLNGYTLSNGGSHLPPLSLLVNMSFTHTQQGQSPSPAADALFGAARSNDNFEIDQVALFYSGVIAPNLGSFIQMTYDEVHKALHWDDSDIRYARQGKLFDTGFVAGVTLNNHPTVQDLWNSTPAWGFPYVSADLLPTPSASTLIDNTLAQRVIGLGAYTLWNDWIFAEVDGYQPLGRTLLDAVGIPTSGATNYNGVLPYWRFAVQHSFGDHYFEAGTYGISGNAFPGGDQTAGTDHLTDTAFDATYQWTGSADHFISAHTTYIAEQLRLNASGLLVSSNPRDHLSTFRADLSYAYKDTLIPSVQYFSTWGSNDANYWGTATGVPNSSGIKVELAYAPFGKLDSFSRFYNARLALQYTAYNKFNGTSAGASGNNTLLLLLQLDGAAW